MTWESGRGRQVLVEHGRRRDVHGVAGRGSAEQREGQGRCGAKKARSGKLAGVTKADVVGFGMSTQAGGPPAAYLAGSVNGARGLFRSDDAGATWSEISDARHQFATVQAITGDLRLYGRVYVGTNGLGIFYGDIAQ